MEVGEDLVASRASADLYFGSAARGRLFVRDRGEFMKLKVIIHEADEGGYWAEVPSIPGCATQGETFDELLKNLYEAVEGCLSVDLKDTKLTEKDRILEIAV